MPTTKEKSAQLDLESLHLKSGAHASPDKGMCVMEAVAFMAGEPFSDHPQCACPVISSFLRRWNDRASDEERQELKRYIPLLIGSRSTKEVARRRVWLAADWAVRTVVPAYLENAKLKDHAAKVAALSELIDKATWREAEPVLAAARFASREKYNAYAYAYAYDAAYAYAYAAYAASEKVRAGLTASAHQLVVRMLDIK